MTKDIIVGQTWFFDEQKESYLHILLIEEPVPDTIICHIAIENIHINGPNNKPITSVGHLPFRLDAVQNSLTALKAEEEPLPDFREGYNQWKDAFEAGKAGFFTVSVAESIIYLEQAFL